jgi:flagellar basal-body rod protein FlgF
MENALLIGLSRQVALSRELDVIANNMANVNTAGFKSRSLRFEEYLSSQASADLFPVQDQPVSYVVDKGSGLDLTAGPIEPTGNPLHAAIRGNGLFVVNTPQGERYTRDGSFQLNQRGELVTQDGYTVMGESGPFVFAESEGQIQIAGDGTVSSSVGQKGRLRLVAADPQNLTNVGSNLYSAQTPPAIAPRETRVVSGAIEGSNVRPVLEMSRLIEVNRAYSSISSMLQATDSLRRSAIERLGTIPS